MKMFLQIGRQRLIHLGTDESGAAFVVTLAVFLFMFLLCSGVYAVGDAVRQKIELQNAADAAAYSAAVIEADTLSRVATVNRAMAWTYLQMTRRQMDFIVDQWLRLVSQRMNEDRRSMRNFHQVFGLCEGQHYRGPQASTWWCGLYTVDQLTAMNFDAFPIPNNIQSVMDGARSTFVAHQAAQKNSGQIYLVASQILFDKVNITAMNLALPAIIQKMPQKIKSVVPEILRANLPQTVHHDIHYYLKQNEMPLTSYFRWLRNNKTDELQFLAFAMTKNENSRNLSASKISKRYPTRIYGYINKQYASDDTGDLIGGSGSRIAGGVNHWFIRGDGNQGESSVANQVGIQRCYRFGANGLSSQFQDKPISSTSCRNRDMDNDSSPSQSYALVAEWHWSATKWFCLPRTFWTPPIHLALRSATSCDHCKGGSKINQVRNNCTWPVIDYNGSGPTLLPPFLPLAGGGRAYGDDPELLRDFKASHYIGAKCCPLVLTREYFGDSMGFGRDGSIVVGAARTAHNPWDFVFGKASEGIYKAFNPKVKALWAVSAARAGYRDYYAGANANQSVGCYQLAWTDPVPSNPTSQQLSKIWNLCVTDWDAVLLPVRHARKSCIGTLGGASLFFSGSDDVLSSLMTSSWTSLSGGSSSSYQSISAPGGMSGQLDWSGLSKKLNH